MKFRTSDLVDDDLDCAIALCKPVELFIAAGLPIGEDISPTSNRAQCNAIIRGAGITVRLDGAYWASKQSDDGFPISMQTGQSESTAALRCHVHSIFGDTIDIPDVMLKPRNQDEDLPLEKTAPALNALSAPEIELESSHEQSGRDELTKDNHRALRDALRLMIDSSGQHATMPLPDARRRAIRVLAKIEEDTGDFSGIQKYGLLHRLKNWVCGQ